MDDANNEQLIAWIKIIMITTGVWNQPISKICFIQNVFNAYSVFMRSGCVVFWLLLVAELIRKTFANYPLPIVIPSLGVVVNATKLGSKTFIYLKNHLLEMFKDVIENEREVWKSNEEIKKVYREKIRICRVYVGSLASATILAVAFLVAKGAFSTAEIKRYNEANNATLESYYMYMMWFPRDNLKNLPLTFSLQALWSWVAINFNCFTHLAFATLLIYAASRLQILQVRLRNYIESDFSEEPSKEQIKEKIAVLKSLILEHKYIIGFVGDLNDRTKNIIMMEFVLSSFDLASVSVSLIKMDVSQIAWQFSFFVLLGVQMYVLAWNCNEINIQKRSLILEDQVSPIADFKQLVLMSYTESAAIADAVYESKWYLLNKEGRQLTQIMIIRAQKPLAMTIGLFGPMTNQSAILSMKGAYSYVSIMRE